MTETLTEDAKLIAGAHRAAWLRAGLRYRPWRPLHVAVVVRDVLWSGRRAVESDRVHLQALLDWLCRAQDIRRGALDEGGVSAGWSFEDGWLPSYPETSGYIVETLVAAADVLGREELRSRAHRILDWELGLQQPTGAFPGHFGESGSYPVVFNTGQIIHGLVCGYLELSRQECLSAATRAGWWLLRQQDDDGCWRRSTHNGIPHTYNTRAAWALARIGLLANERSFVAGAKRNVEWAVQQQTPSGWFRQNAFRADQVPFTHTIAYAIRGILELGVLLEREEWLRAAAKAASGVAQRLEHNGFLPGALADNWRPKASYCCLTGLAQMGIVWSRLSTETGAVEYRQPAQRAIEFLKAHHRLAGDGSPDDGGIAGSVPIWGAYSRFEFPNWAAKFFSDLLMHQGYGIVIPQDRAIYSKSEVVAECPSNV